MIIEFLNNNPQRRWHSMECARRSLGPDADVRDLPNDAPEAAALTAAKSAQRDAERAINTDNVILREQILGETPEQWAARTNADRWLIVLRILKHWARRG